MFVYPWLHFDTHKLFQLWDMNTSEPHFSLKQEKKKITLSISFFCLADEEALLDRGAVKTAVSVN